MGSAKNSASRKSERGAGAAQDVHVSGWQEEAAAAPSRKRFPVEQPVDEAVRIDIFGSAYSEVHSHAKKSLDQEVCGVLVGVLYQDEAGVWVQAEAAIRGTAAKQGGAHVTYTQETWEKIYEIKDKEYPKLSIVGWYHTHPGFGVEFSEMDRFIQQNFFAGPAQFALVLDPLSGDEAVCVNTPDGVQNLDRFWVEGRQRRCWTPRRTDAAGGDGAATGAVEKRLQAVEQRLSQLLQATEEERQTHHRYLSSVVLLLTFAVAVWICMTVYSRFAGALPKPPQLQNWVPVAVKIDGKEVMLGVGIHKWDVPPELNAALLELERLRAAAKEQQQATPAPTEQDEEDDAPIGFAWSSAIPLVLLALVVLALVAALAGPALQRRRRIRKRSGKGERT